MTILYGKSPFYRTSILLWLSVGLAGLMLGGLPIVAQTGTTSHSQGGVTRREAAGAIAAREQSEVPTNEGSSKGSLPERQKRLLLKDNLERMKRDAGELANLTKALQEELDKANENVLALDIVAKADKIQKLAKKIKGNARGI
jgi:2C-methyl-D-erythritol 2,4-cyclodiphosphate synthase